MPVCWNLLHVDSNTTLWCHSCRSICWCEITQSPNGSVLKIYNNCIKLHCNFELRKFNTVAMSNNCHQLTTVAPLNKICCEETWLMGNYCWRVTHSSKEHGQKGTFQSISGMACCCGKSCTTKTELWIVECIIVAGKWGSVNWDLFGKRRTLALCKNPLCDRSLNVMWQR